MNLGAFDKMERWAKLHNETIIRYLRR